MYQVKFLEYTSLDYVAGANQRYITPAIAPSSFWGVSKSHCQAVTLSFVLLSKDCTTYYTKKSQRVHSHNHFGLGYARICFSHAQWDSTTGGEYRADH